MKKKVKLTDYLAFFLKKKKIKNIYGVTGGANLHIIDSISKIKNQKIIFNHHEQASAFAAQASPRLNGTPSVCIVTTGPAGTNSLTGVLSAWQDSIPTIFISGQSRSKIIKNSGERRQFGNQGFKISNFVKKITKKSLTIYNPEAFPKILKECYEICRSGRPGPVWIDIPLDVQTSLIELRKINNVSKTEKHKKINFDKFYKLIENSKRPIILAGNGGNMSNSKILFRDFLKNINIPSLFTWNGSNLLAHDNKLNCGIPGIFGQRAANIILQKSDLIVALGTTLGLSITTPNFKNFAPKAKIIHIDQDNQEIKHFNKRIKMGLKIDLNYFFKEAKKNYISTLKKNNWLDFCSFVKKRYNKLYIKTKKNYIDPYDFVDLFSKKTSKNGSIVIDGGGTCNQIFFQAFKNIKNQRAFVSAGVCAMGSGIPDGIGIASSLEKRNKVNVICGDGSFQFNVQELQTLKDNNLNINIFVFSNKSYLSIRHTQKEFLNKRYFGSSKKGGLNVPNIENITKAYKIKYFSFNNIHSLSENFNKINNYKKSSVIELIMDPSYEIKPKISFNKKSRGKFVASTLDNMYPFLKHNEINNLLKIYEKKKY